MPVRRPGSLAVLLLLCLSLVGFASPGAARDARSAADEGRRVVELKAPVPDWYTPSLHDRVVAAADRGEGVPLPKRADVDSSLLFMGIRPGSWMIFPSGCTLNFVFGDPSTTSSPGNGNGGGNGNGNGQGNPNGGQGTPHSGNSGVFIGTAGHCTDVGEEVTIVALPGILMDIGTTVTSVDNGIGDDFALIELHPEMVEFVNASMAITAGPTGSKTPVFGDPVLHVGHGLVFGAGGTARPGAVTWTGAGGNPIPIVGGADDPNGYGWDGLASPGDSGSPVRALTGEAVGNLTHLVVGTGYLPSYIAGTTIDRLLEIAAAPLATAGLLPDPLP